jgi:threonine/homoserine/homoserine lactone efflux protein
MPHPYPGAAEKHRAAHLVSSREPEGRKSADAWAVLLDTGRMDLMLGLRGVAFGLAVAAPVGPIGVLCIRRTLTRGRAVGVASGLGAATADLTYGLVVALGLTAVVERLEDVQTPLRIVGGLVLLAIAVSTWRTQPAEVGEPVRDARTLRRAYVSTFGLTLTNPATILTFVALFTSLGIAEAAGSTAEAVLLVAGVGLGSALWWLLLATGVGWLRVRLSQSVLHRVNIVSALVLGAFGVLAVASTF